MFVPVLFLLAAAVLGYLSEIDRVSVLALAVVELEHRVHTPLWVPFGVIGGVLLALRMWHARAPVPPPRPRPITRDAARTAGVVGSATPPPSGDWLTTIRAQARLVTDDAMGRVRFEEAPGVPITLVLTAVTPEQARRRIAAYAKWLATIPTPPVARVRVVSSPDIEGPLHGLLRGELVRHFPGDAFTSVSRSDGADAVFSRPDPRWG